MRTHGARAAQRRSIVEAALATRPPVVQPAIWPDSVLFARDADYTRAIADRIHRQYRGGRL